MKVGVVGSYGTAGQLLALAEAAEASGWDGYFAWDGISVGPMDTFDPWALLGAVAVKTSRITLGAMVFALPRQQPWKVARESITVDQLSAGRLVMPVGLGAVDDGGFSRVSGGVTDRRTRAELLDDTLAILDKAWSGETFSYSGTHHSVTDLVFRPIPIAQPRIPLWVVGAYPSTRSLRRALRSDGTLPQRTDRPPMTPLEPADVAEIAGYVNEQRHAATPFEIVVEGKLPTDRNEAADRLAAFDEAGATWWIESHWDGPTSQPQNLLALVNQGPATNR